MVKKTKKHERTKKTFKTLKNVPESNFFKWANKNKYIEWSTDDINNFIIKGMFKKNCVFICIFLGFIL